MTRRTFTLRSLGLSFAGLFGYRSKAKAIAIDPNLRILSGKILVRPNGCPAFRLVVPWEGRFATVNDWLGKNLVDENLKEWPVHSVSITGEGLDLEHSRFERAVIIVLSGPPLTECV